MVFDIFSKVPCYGYLLLVDIPEEGKTDTYIYLLINFPKKLCLLGGKIYKNNAVGKTHVFFQHL